MTTWRLPDLDPSRKSCAQYFFGTCCGREPTWLENRIDQYNFSIRHRLVNDITCPLLLKRLHPLHLISLAYLNFMPARGHLSLQGQGEIVARLSEIITQDNRNLVVLDVGVNGAVHAFSHILGHVLKRGHPQFVPL